MPLFRSSRNSDPVAPAAPVEETPTRKGSIFSSRRQAVSPTTTTSARSNRYSTDGAPPTSRTGRRGFFSRRRNSSSSSDLSDRRAADSHAAAAGGIGFFGGSRHNDPTLDAARGKVHAAELAEKEADRALVAARSAVVDAKRHVEILEKEANEQARLAQAKVLAARGVKGDARNLGRHN